MPYSWTTISSLLLLYAVCSTGLSAQNAMVHGSALPFGGMDIVVTIYEDPISRKVGASTQSAIDSIGHFSLSIPVADTCEAWLSIRRFSAPIYLYPGANYEILIGDDNEYVLINTWQKGELLYSFSKLEADTQTFVKNADLNIAIARIDRAYYAFFADNAEVLGTRTMRSNLTIFRKELEPQFSPSSFIGVHAKFTIAEMMLLSGISRKEVFDNSLAAHEWQAEHPAWFSFFGLFFENYFQSFGNAYGGDEMYNRINAGLDFNDLDSLLQKDDFLTRADLRHTLILNEISRNYQNKLYKPKALKGILESMQTDKKVQPALQKLAGELKDRLAKSGVGMPAADLGLDISLLQSGKPTLLFITAPWSTVSKREAISLAMLFEKYTEDFLVVEITTEAMGSDDATSRGNWARAQPENVAAFMDYLNLHSLPACVWLNEYGVVENTNMDLPSMGLERILHKRKVARESANTIKVGQ